MALTELSIRQLKPKERSYMVSDGRQGLYIEVRPNGNKYWISRLWIGDKEKRSSLGAYPDVTLKQARDKHYELRKAMETGKPPSETFAVVAAEWLEKRMLPKATEGYLRTIRQRLARFILPEIGDKKLEDLTSSVILQLCRKIEDRGIIETAVRVKTIIGQVFDYAIATSRAETNPTLALKGALQTRKVKHHATLTEPAKIALLMRHIDEYPYEVVRCALKFSALVFCRPGEVRAAEWKEIDWPKQEWHIPAERMKMKTPHIVPLARQTVEVLKDLQKVTGKDKFLFPSSGHNGRCMSENTILMALRSMGYGSGDMTPHGFRGMASTVLYENGFPSDIIERQLAHAERNKVKAAYNHAEYLPQRRDMMRWWADWLDALNQPVAAEPS